MLDSVAEGKKHLWITSSEIGAASEEELVARSLVGDSESLALLYRRFYPKVYGYMLARLGDSTNAEDASQDVFFKMVDKLDTYRGVRGSFAGWLFRIAQNTVIDVFRSRRQAPLPLTGDPPQRLTIPPFEEQVEQSVLFVKVNQAIQNLPAAQQEVVTLRFHAELSIKETARITGKAEGTIKALQFQAVQTLRRALSRDT